MRRWSAGALTAVLASSGAAVASASETLAVTGGFYPDPQTVEIAALGEAPASDQVRGCPGAITVEPALVVTLDEATTPMRFFATGEGLAGLVAEGPDGIFHCAGRDGIGIATIRMSAALDGDYRLWPAVGAVGDTATIRVAVSELDLSPGDLLPPGAALGREAPPAAGRHALAEDGSLVLSIDLSGTDSASAAGPGCAGRLDASRPDVVIGLAGPAPELHFDVDAAADTTLVVIDPTGTVHCDDDSFGYDPAIAVSPAPAGDYAVWVGLYGAETGQTGRLTVGHEAPARSDAFDAWAGEDESFEWNPFAGRDIPTARAALDILLVELGLGDIVTFATIEEPGPEAVTLTDVVLQDPEDPSLRLPIGRIAISDLDLEGLGTSDGPRRFSITLEAIDYSGLAEGLRSLDVLPLPELGSSPTLTLAASVLPVPDGDGRLAARLLGQLDEEIGIGIEVIARPAGDPAGGTPSLFDEMLSEAFRLELTNWGYLGAFLRAQAEEEGKPLDAYIEDGLAELRQELQPMRDGSPAAAIHEAVSALLGDADNAGVLRLSLETDEPRGLDVLLEELSESDTLEDERLRFSITYESTP